MRGSPYIRLLAIRAVRQPLVGVVIGRLPIAATTLAVVLLVRGETGSFAIAGAVDACISIAAGVALPVAGRLIDRYGQTGVLAFCAVLNPVGLVALVAAAKGGASAGALCLIAVVIGGAFPPLSPAMRTLWRSIVADEGLRQSAFAFDAVLVETAFIVGPLLTAIIVSAASPAAAVGANAGFAALGTGIFAFSKASRSWRGAEASHGWLAAIASRSVQGLLAAEFSFGFAIGAMELATTAFATQHGSPSTAGALIAVQAAASMAGGLWYGSTHRAEPAGRRFPRTAIAIAICFAPLPLASSFTALFPLMALSGFAFAPSSAAGFSLIDEIARPGAETETSSWVTTALIAGVALGTALTGAVVGGGHADLGYALAVGATLVGATIAFASRNGWAAASGTPVRSVESVAE